MKYKLSEIWSHSVLTRGVLLAMFSIHQSHALTLEDAQTRLLTQHPQLVEYHAYLQIAHANAELADQTAPWNLGLETSDIAGTGDYSGIDRAETSLYLSSEFELGNKRASRVGRSQADTELLHAQQNVQRLNLINDLANQFSAALAQQERCQLNAEDLALKQRVLLLVQERVNKAAAPEVEALRAEVAHHQAALAMKRCQAQLTSEYQKLATTMGQTQVDFLHVSGEFYRPPATDASTAFEDRLLSSPNLLIFTKQLAAQQAEEALLKAQDKPNVQWRVGITHYAETDDAALGLGLEIPLFSERRNHPQLRAAQAQTTAILAQEQQAQQALMSEFNDAFQAYQQDRSTLEHLTAEILPLLERAYQQAQLAYQQGRYDYSEWFLSGQELLSLKSQIIDVAENAWQQKNTLERLLGGRL